MSLPRYAEYRSSGVEWLADLPSHWVVRKFRHSFQESSEKIEGEVVGPMLSVSGYRGIEIKDYDDENRRRTDQELQGYRIVRRGQLVVNTMWLNYAGLGVSAHEGHVSPAYRAYWISADLEPRFVHHMMRSGEFVKGYTKFLTGVRPNSLQMGREDLMEFRLAEPPRDEQVAIANFLDHKTAKIDTLIAEQEKLLALLAEKRQATISHAVTRGLNPNVPMKDSGFAWLGDIPAHWDVLPLKRDLAFLTSGSRGWAEHYADEGALFLRIGNFTRDSVELDLGDIQRVSPPGGAEGERTMVESGDVLFSITAYLGSVAVVPEELEKGYVSQHVALARLRNAYFLPKWVAYATLSCLGSTYLATQGYGGTKVQLSLDDIACLPVTAPSLDEQQATIDLIERELRKFERVRIDSESAIDLLRERRSALIAAAVTGKIDVRNAVPQEAVAA